MDILNWTGVLKKTAFTILFCALFVLITNKAYAQTGGMVKLEARAGLDGACKINAWMPVRVTVENTGGDFDARVQVSYKNDPGGQSVYAMDISLPATSRKEFFIYVHPTGSLRNFSVSVLEGTTIRAEKKLNVSCWGGDENFDLSVGVLADDPTPYNIINDIRPLSGGKTRLAQLTLSDLPDRAEGWAVLDALIVSNVDTGKLSPEQKQALQLWIANGGKLFISGGIHWQTTTAGLQDFMPIKIVSTKNVINLTALSAYIKNLDPLGHEAILASGKLSDDARTLVEQNNTPLLIEKQIGYGKVYYFAADPGLQPLNNWDGMKDIYNHLLAFRPQKPGWANSVFDSNQANNALSALPELNLPSFFYICCWLGLYIIAIGPINYFILRRAKRTELAWVTVPVLVILFSCLAYISGFAYRGINPILNRLALVQGWEDVSQARVNDLVGVYSPSRTTYTIQTQDKFMLYENPSIDSRLQGNDNWLSLKNESGMTLPDVRVEIGGMRTISAEGFMPVINIQNDLILTLSKNTPKLSGTITNASPYILREAILITPSEWKILGDLKSNETKTITNLFVNATALPADTYTLLTDLGMSIYPPSKDTEVSRRSAFFQANIDSARVSGIYLMGWVEGISAPVNLQDQNSKATDTTLYFHKLTPTLMTSAQPFSINSNMYDWESSNGTITTYQIPTDGYILHFQTSLPVNFSEVSSLALEIQTNTTPDKVETALWNFESETWETTPLLWTSQTNFVPNPDQYVGADGEIRIKFNADQNDYVQINAVNFTLEVKP